MIFIHKSDSTIFADQKKFLTFDIKTDYALTGWKAIFCLCSVKKTIEDISSKSFEVILTAKDTSKLYYGKPFGEIKLVDKEGNIKTISNDIPFCVTNGIVENEAQTIDLDIPKSEGIEISVSYAGSGGTSNYEELENKPSINDVELVGNKSLDDLGIQPKGTYLTEHQDISHLASKEELSQGLETKQPKGNYLTEHQDISHLATKQEIESKANNSEVIHLANDETIIGAKTFTQPLKIQNGQGTGSLWIGGDVNSGTLTNNARKLARISVPSFANITLATTLLGFDSSGDTDLHVTNRSLDAVSFGGQKKITNATSPLSIGFCVATTRGTTKAENKVYPLEMDANEARFNVQPNYNGVKLATIDDLNNALGDIEQLLSEV